MEALPSLPSFRYYHACGLIPKDKVDLEQMLNQTNTQTIFIVGGWVNSNVVSDTMLWLKGGKWSQKSRLPFKLVGATASGFPTIFVGGTDANGTTSPGGKFGETSSDKVRIIPCPPSQPY